MGRLVFYVWKRSQTKKERPKKLEDEQDLKRPWPMRNVQKLHLVSSCRQKNWARSAKKCQFKCSENCTCRKRQAHFEYFSSLGRAAQGTILPSYWSGVINSRKSAPKSCRNPNYMFPAVTHSDEDSCEGSLCEVLVNRNWGRTRTIRKKDDSKQTHSNPTSSCKASLYPCGQLSRGEQIGVHRVFFF